MYNTYMYVQYISLKGDILSLEKKRKFLIMPGKG